MPESASPGPASPGSASPGPAGKWRAIAEQGYAVPPDCDLESAARELSTALADPDPAVRDGAPYSVLARWIRLGVLDDQLKWLGDAMAARFADERIEARAFAPLVLAWIAEHGVVADNWVGAFRAWYPAETDLRGHDGTLGWLHAVAHGSDLLGVFGRDTRVAPALMLATASERLTAPTGFVWRDAEEDRLACAIALTLTRPELTEAESVAWLAPIADAFHAIEPGPPPAWASNALRTLRMLYILAVRGVRGDDRPTEVLPLAHGAAVAAAILGVNAIAAPFTG